MTLITATIAARALGTDEQGLVRLCVRGVVTPRNINTGEMERIDVLFLSSKYRKRLAALLGGRREPFQDIGFDLAEIEAVKSLPQGVVSPRADAPLAETHPQRKTSKPDEKLVKELQGSRPWTREVRLDLCRELDRRFPGVLTDAEMGDLLPSNPGATVTHAAKRAQGQRLRGKKK